MPTPAVAAAPALGVSTDDDTAVPPGVEWCSGYVLDAGVQYAERQSCDSA